MYKFVVLAACLAVANAGVLPGLSPWAVGSSWASPVALGGPTIVKQLAPHPLIVNSAPLLGSPIIKSGISPIGLGSVVSPIGIGPAVIKSPLGLGAW